MASALSKTTSARAAGSLSGGPGHRAIANNTGITSSPSVALIRGRRCAFQRRRHPRRPCRHELHAKAPHRLQPHRWRGRGPRSCRSGNCTLLAGPRQRQRGFRRPDDGLRRTTPAPFRQAMQVLAMLQVYLTRNSTAIGARVQSVALGLRRSIPRPTPMATWASRRRERAASAQYALAHCPDEHERPGRAVTDPAPKCWLAVGRRRCDRLQGMN